jgi:hypothetical protein
LRAGLAEVVDHDVEYGEEGVHIDHERRFLSLRERYRQADSSSWTPSAQVSMDNSHQAFNGETFRNDRFSGTYTVKANCTGTVTFKDGAATQGDVFIAPDGSMFAFVRTTPEDVAAGIDPQVTAKRVGE